MDSITDGISATEQPAGVPDKDAEKKAALEAAATTSNSAAGKKSLGRNDTSLACKLSSVALRSQSFYTTQLRLVFPALQRNESPFTILPNWLQVLGRKVDSATVIQERI